MGGPSCICRANPCLPGHNSTGSGLAMNEQVLPVSYPRRDLKPMMIDTHRDVARHHIELDLHGYVLMLIKKRGIPIPGPTGETKGVDLTEEYLFTGGIGSQPRSTIGKRKMGREGKQTGVWDVMSDTSITDKKRLQRSLTKEENDNMMNKTSLSKRIQGFLGKDYGFYEGHMIRNEPGAHNQQWHRDYSDTDTNIIMYLVKLS